MGTDTLALVIALIAVRLSRRPPDSERTFGYVRTEAMGAMLNGMLKIREAITEFNGGCFGSMKG